MVYLCIILYFLGGVVCMGIMCDNSPTLTFKEKLMYVITALFWPFITVIGIGVGIYGLLTGDED